MECTEQGVCEAQCISKFDSGSDAVSGSATRQKFRVSIGQVRPKVAGLAEEGRLRENKETTQKERESRVILACTHVHNWMDSLRSKFWETRSQSRTRT